MAVFAELPHAAEQWGRQQTRVRVHTQSLSSDSVASDHGQRVWAARLVCLIWCTASAALESGEVGPCSPCAAGVCWFWGIPSLGALDWTELGRGCCAGASVQPVLFLLWSY